VFALPAIVPPVARIVMRGRPLAALSPDVCAIDRHDTDARDTKARTDGSVHGLRVMTLAPF
jgi:hypothetical protein